MARHPRSLLTSSICILALSVIQMADEAKVDSQNTTIVYETVTALEGKVLGELFSAAGREAQTNPDIDTATIPPDVAFEVFAGRRYWGSSSDDFSDDVSKFQTELSERLKEVQRSPSKGIVRAETPLEKYNRLRAEVVNFENDVHILEAIKKHQDGQVIVDHLLPKVKDGVAAILNQLARLEGKPDLGVLLLSGSSEQSLLQTQQKLSSQLDDAVKSLAASDAPEDSCDPKMIDECSLENAAVDARLSRLETVLGPPRTNGDSLFETLRLMEERFKNLEREQVDSVQRRTKALTSELDNLSKKMRRYGSALAPGQETDQQKEKILGMYEKMMKWDYIADELPLILDRLKSVERIYKASAKFESRVSQMELLQTTIHEHLKRDEMLLNNLETSILENSDIMQKNISALDDRFLKASQKH